MFVEIYLNVSKSFHNFYYKSGISATININETILCVIFKKPAKFKFKCGIEKTRQFNNFIKIRRNKTNLYFKSKIIIFLINYQIFH